MNEDVDTSILQRTSAQLDDALRFTRLHPIESGDPIAVHLRAGAIQAFEFTYELALSTIKAYIRRFSEFQSISRQLTFNELIRAGYQLEVVPSELVVWQRFRDLRNLTSHTHQQATAEELMEILPEFAVEIHEVIERIDNAKRR